MSLGAIKNSSQDQKNKKQIYTKERANLKSKLSIITIAQVFTNVATMILIGKDQ